METLHHEECTVISKLSGTCNILSITSVHENCWRDSVLIMEKSRRERNLKDSFRDER